MACASRLHDGGLGAGEGAEVIQPYELSCLNAAPFGAGVVRLELLVVVVRGLELPKAVARRKGR